MEDHRRSRSYANGDMMQIESYNPGSRDLRCYSASYADSQRQNSRDHPNKLKKEKSASGSSWNLSDPEFQRKRRVASYKMYGMEGKVKGSFRRSFRWLKDRYTQVFYGW